MSLFRGKLRPNVRQGVKLSLTAGRFRSQQSGDVRITSPPDYEMGTLHIHRVKEQLRRDMSRKLKEEWSSSLAQSEC